MCWVSSLNLLGSQIMFVHYLSLNPLHKLLFQSPRTSSGHSLVRIFINKSSHLVNLNRSHKECNCYIIWPIPKTCHVWLGPFPIFEQASGYKNKAMLPPQPGLSNEYITLVFFLFFPSILLCPNYPFEFSMSDKSVTQLSMLNAGLIDF